MKPNQADLFDLDVENRKRDASIDSVARAAGQRWQAWAELAAGEVLRRDGDTDSSRARAVLRSWGISEAVEPRAWGPVMRRLVATHGLVRLSYRPGGSHGRSIAVWGVAS